MNIKEEAFVLLTLPIALIMNIMLEKWWRKGLLDKLPRRPRFIHWVIATWGSFYWLPCVLCDKSHGGHEPSGMLSTSYGSETSVCINCKEEADKKNKEVNYHIPDRRLNEEI